MTLNFWPKVDIIVLNWNGWQATLECLESLFKIDYPNYRIIIIDNASDDGSVERIKQWAEKCVEFDREAKPLVTIEYDRETAEQGGKKDLEKMIEILTPHAGFIIIRNEKNFGFSRGNNVGIRYALARGADYILLLNNDTVVTKQFLTELIKFSEESGKFSAASPLPLDYKNANPQQWQSPVLRRFNFWGWLIIFTVLNKLLRKTKLYKRWFFQGSLPQQVYSLSGSCILFNSSALKSISLLDENIFLYWEEFVIAEQLARLNLKSYIVPSSIIYHKQGISTSKLGPRKFIESLRSEGYFFSRYIRLSGYQKVPFLLLRIIIYIFRCLRDASYRKRENITCFIKGIQDYLNFSWKNKSDPITRE